MSRTLDGSTSSTWRRWPPARSASPRPRTRCARAPFSTPPSRRCHPTGCSRRCCTSARPSPAVEVRVFVPERPQGVCIEFHAGAWIIGSARAGDDRSAEIAERCSVAVVSVEYRMVPEAPAAGPARGRPQRDRLGAHRRARPRGRRSHRARSASRPAAPSPCSAWWRCGTRARWARTSWVPRWPTASTTCPAAPASASTPPRWLSSTTPSRWCTPGSRWSSGASRRSRRSTPISTALPPALFSVGTADALIDDTLFMYERWIGGGERRPARRVPRVAARLRHVPHDDGGRGPPPHRRLHHGALVGAAPQPPARAEANV